MDKDKLELLKHMLMGGVTIKDNDPTYGGEETVDLHHYQHGKKKTEGGDLNSQMEKLEKRLDQALQNGTHSLKIVHGKGSGNLKKAVEDYIKQHPHVRSFQSHAGETIAFFK